MTYAQLLAYIDQHINTKTGGDRITGALDNMVRKQMIAAIVEIASTGFGAELAISDAPGSPASPTYFLAKEVGTYENAGGVVVENLPAFIIWSGSAWSVREFAPIVEVIAPESPAKGIVVAGAPAPSAPALKDWYVFVGPGELTWPGQPKTSPGIVYCTSINPIRWNFQPFSEASDGAVEEITVENAQVFDPDREGGYKAGNVYVSYVNPNSEDPLFLQEALYRCDADAAMGESPESHPEKWIYQGDRVTVVSRNTATSIVTSLDDLRKIQGMKTSDTVIVYNVGYYYRFDASVETGEKPNDGSVGSWVKRGRFNKSGLIDIVDAAKVGSDFFLQNIDDTLIVLVPGQIGIEDGTQTVFYLDIIEPSFVVKIGAGFTEADYKIQPISTGGSGASGLPSTWEQDAAAIRALVLHDDGMDVGNYATNAIYEYDAAATAADDGDVYLKPDDVAVGDPGRWVKQKIFSVNGHGHTTDQIIQQLELLKLNLPANSPLHTILESIDNFLAGTLNTDEIDDAGWAISERRLAILENTINGVQIQGAALLLDIFAPPGVEESLRNNSGWTNETKTLTGDNSTGQLGQKGAMIWLNDAVYAQCVSAVLDVSGSATYRRNRAVDVLDPDNNTQDAAIANELDPSYTYPAMTPTGNSTDDGWNLTSQVKVITGKPTRWGMWFIGGMNGDGYTYHCFLVSGTTSYWKRTGTPSSISRCVYAATHPNLTTNLLAHDFGTGAYTQISGDEVTYADQTFYDATTRSYFIKMINGNWEKIR